MNALRGRRFVKMTGSGNDFVMLDARDARTALAVDAELIRRLCARGTGVGADGLVILEPERGVDFRMTYFNADGTRAAMCGNAALCSTRLALVGEGGREVRFATDSGPVTGRLRDGRPEIDIAPVSVIQPDGPVRPAPDEVRVGHAVAGVPHVTVLRRELETLDVVRRGREIRLSKELRPEGANANFVAAMPDGEWAIRTYERGVEDETLACGTGAVASALLLQTWGVARAPVSLRTRSGLSLTVRLRQEGSQWFPSLLGEGRIVFSGELAEI